MAKDLEAQVIETTAPPDCDDANDAAPTLDATPCDVEPNAAPPTPTFPASKRAIGKAMGTPDVTIGRWCTGLETHGVRVLDDAGKVTERGYTRLVALKDATQNRGIKLSDYLESLTPDAPAKHPPTDEPETVDAELMEPITRLGNTPNDGSEYAMVVSQQHDALTITGARLDLERQRLMESLQTIADAKQEQEAMQSEHDANKRKKWDLEVMEDLSEEYTYKIKREQEIRRKLGI